MNSTKGKYDQIIDTLGKVRRTIRHQQLLNDLKKIPRKTITTTTKLTVEHYNNQLYVDGILACTFHGDDHYVIEDPEKMALLLGISNAK